MRLRAGWWAVGEVTSTSLEHISTHLCTTKSMVSISSLPFNCSQLEHVAFRHGSAGVAHTHTHTHVHTRAHTLMQGTLWGQCEGAAGVLMWLCFGPIHFRAMSHEDSDFPSGQFRMWTSLSPSCKSDVTHQTCLNVSSLCVCVWCCKDAGSQVVKLSAGRGLDWLKGSFLPPGPHSEVSITATTKEMFF